MQTASDRVPAAHASVDSAPYVLTVAEASAATGVPQATLRLWIRRGRLTVVDVRSSDRGGLPARCCCVRLADVRHLESERERISRELEERRTRVLELYENERLSLRAIALEVGVSRQVVSSDLDALGISRRPRGRQPWKYSPPAARPCKWCGKVFTPKAANVAAGWGRYHSRRCHDEARAVYPDPGERVCARKGCERQFRPARNEAGRGKGRFCSLSCWARERWRLGLVTVVIEHWGGRARQRWLGRWKGRAHGALGGRPRVQISPEQASMIAKLAARGWGRRAIASRLGISEWAVRTALEEFARAEESPLAA